LLLGRGCTCWVLAQGGFRPFFRPPNLPAPRVMPEAPQREESWWRYLLGCGCLLVVSAAIVLLPGSPVERALSGEGRLTDVAARPTAASPRQHVAMHPSDSARWEARQVRGRGRGGRGRRGGQRRRHPHESATSSRSPPQPTVDEASVGLPPLPSGPPGEWPCVVLGDFDCPGLDEMRGPGCQVRCGGTDGCQRGHRKCQQQRGCGAVNVNDEGTWATLKRRVGRNGAVAGGEAARWCAQLQTRQTRQTRQTLQLHRPSPHPDPNPDPNPRQVRAEAADAAARRLRRRGRDVRSGGWLSH
jgi:hypothetical protein